MAQVSIKSIILAAWRAKLSNEELENRIRKVLPRGVNGDVYDLADCLLKQALVGPVPNQLFISYLKHAVQCELVSHSAVLSSIAQQPINLKSSSLLNRTSPIICLLEFLKLFRDKISCKGTEIECLNLCHSLSKFIHWLLKCVLMTIEFMINNTQQQTAISQQQSNNIINANTNISNNNINNQPTIINSSPGGIIYQNDTTLSIIELCTETIHFFIDKPFTKSLLFISKIECKKEFDDNILGTVHTIQEKILSCPNMLFIQEKLQYFKALNQLNLTFNTIELHPSVVAAQQLHCLQAHRIRSIQVTSLSSSQQDLRIHEQQHFSTYVHNSTTNYALFNSLYPLIASDAVLRLARSHKHLANQILTITNFHSAPAYMTYCELIRVCMIGLIDAGKSKLRASWPFFTFLKLPKLLIELSKAFKKHHHYHQQSKKSTSDQTSSSSSSSIPIQNGTNFVNDLSQALERLFAYAPLVHEAEYKFADFFKCLIKELIKNDPSLYQLKNLPPFSARRPISSNNNDIKSGCHMILKTEPVVTSMLETLNSEQDPTELFSILCQQCSGISFEYTLIAAAATGRLHLFVKRLVEHNELYKISKNDLPHKHQLAIALNFDITFLILIYIAQRYGPELIDKDSTTTFCKWYHDRYDQATCFNCPKEMLKDCDDEIVSSLIQQLANPKSDIQMRSSNWHEACFNMPKVISEILNAWDQSILNDDDIVLIIERLRTRMCFLAVVAATWLQCYIKTLNEVDRAKPLFILNSLSKTSQQAKQQSQLSNNDSNNLKSDGYDERSSLSSAIIRRIYFELVPSISFVSNGNNNIPTMSSSSLAAAAAKQQISSTMLKNRLVVPNVSVFGGGGGGGQLESSVSDDSQDDTAYHSYKGKFLSTLTTQEIFLANVKQCLSSGWIDFDSLNSLSSLFKIIGSECFTDLMVEQVLMSHESPSDLSRAVNIAFGLFHLDIEECAFSLLKSTIPNWLLCEKKQTLLSQPRAFALANLTVMTIIEVYTNTQKLDRMNDLIADLMRLFKEIMSDSVMSQRTLFPVLFLEQTVVCAREKSTMMTVHLQPEILLDIINLFSSELTFELVLAISNLSTTNSRKYAAKAMCKLAEIKKSGPSLTTQA